MEYKSKTQRKKEALSLQDIGKKLVGLSAEQLEGIGLPAELYDAVSCAKTIRSRSALRRQMQYIGALMRRYDPVPVQEALRNIELGISRETARFKEIERWRDDLIAGNEAVMDEILGRYPTADAKHIAKLVRDAQREMEEMKPHHAFRALFRYLKKIHEVSSRGAAFTAARKDILQLYRLYD